ncbi:hypothetical protein EVAR_22963_1 [Eumeta japonica]|uniref:Uncharacterized protein n=1 Tax=Eumeta variegata TaxID=151549 RepID=A0A4C1UQK2_EUMVA|nr:hypothetical protein EVAR_22963_1 [Eumeta japonica]
MNASAREFLVVTSHPKSEERLQRSSGRASNISASAGRAVRLAQVRTPPGPYITSLAVRRLRRQLSSVALLSIHCRFLVTIPALLTYSSDFGAARLDPCELRTVLPYTYTLSERSPELHGRRSGGC